MIEKDETTSKFYVYGLIDPSTKIIRYVGFTAKNPAVRLVNHLEESKRENNAKSAWLSNLIDDGQMPEYVTLQICDSAEMAQLAERWWIAHGLTIGWDLVNTTHNRKPKELSQIVRQEISEIVSAKVPNKERTSDLRTIVMEWRRNNPTGSQVDCIRSMASEGIKLSRQYASDLWRMEL